MEVSPYADRPFECAAVRHSGSAALGKSMPRQLNYYIKYNYYIL